MTSSDDSRTISFLPVVSVRTVSGVISIISIKIRVDDHIFIVEPGHVNHIVFSRAKERIAALC